MTGVNPKTGMSHAEAREFIRSHFEEFVNRKGVETGNVNFALGFVDHGADVPPKPSVGTGRRDSVGALEKFPDLHVQIEDMITEDDKVAVRNRWIATDPASGKNLEFRGIVIRRIANRQIHERWAYLETHHPA